MASYLVPTVVEKTPTGERVVDVYSRLLTERVIYLGTEIDDDVAGFVAVGPREDEPIGEIHMVAVDPRYQGRGIGRRLTEVALEWIAEQGLATAMVETAGDPGHAPARRLYGSAGFTPFPIVRYFRTVERS